MPTRQNNRKVLKQHERETFNTERRDLIKQKTRNYCGSEKRKRISNYRQVEAEVS